MKNVITFLMCTLCILTGMAQADLNGNGMIIPERTPELQALYLQSKQLEIKGTAAEINANRLAIKAAWEQVDPAVAALYKPIETTGVGPTMVEREINPDQAQPISRAPEDWSTDLLLREGYIDGLDMDVAGNGDIYIAAYENYVGSGFDDSVTYIYRSTDGGNSFVLWKENLVISSELSKIQLISMDGNGVDYLLLYELFDNGQFTVARWKMSSGDFDFDPVASSITDFSVDRNYTLDTSAQRVFATYQKSDQITYSARSTAGSYGFDWVDEFRFGIVGEQIDFAYGLNGGCYTTFIGFNSKNLKAMENSSFNDPASWSSAVNLTDSSITEVINPTIRAARLEMSNDKVIIWASQRPTGSSEGYDGLGMKRVNGANYINFSGFPAGGSQWSIAQTDSWVRKVNGSEEIRLSYVRDNIPNNENDVNRSLTFNGTDFDPFEPVADTSVNVFEGFSSAIAETSDGLPCMAFAGTSGSDGYNLYFDAKSTLGIEENSLDGFTFYPNPAQDIINISAKSTVEKIGIYSLLGQEVMQLSPEQKSPSLNVSSLASGVYVMKVEVDGQIGTYKIIKK